MKRVQNWSDAYNEEEKKCGGGGASYDANDTVRTRKIKILQKRPVLR